MTIIPENKAHPMNANDARPQFEVALLDILACPLTKTRLEYCRDAQELISKKAGLAFPIRNGIPILLKEEARVMEEPACSILPQNPPS
jgi:uncharacterized protein